MVEDFVFDFQDHSLTYPLCKDAKIPFLENKNKTKKRLRLDLHNCDLKEAMQQLETLLKSIPRKKGISLHIITGKGIHSGEKGAVIKKFTCEYLDNSSIRWKFSPPNKGGVGAIIAFL